MPLEDSDSDSDGEEQDGRGGGPRQRDGSRRSSVCGQQSATPDSCGSRQRLRKPRSPSVRPLKRYARSPSVRPLKRYARMRTSCATAVTRSRRCARRCYKDRDTPTLADAASLVDALDGPYRRDLPAATRRELQQRAAALWGDIDVEIRLGSRASLEIHLAATPALLGRAVPMAGDHQSTEEHLAVIEGHVAAATADAASELLRHS